MASSTTPVREWLVIIPDHQDMLEKRLEIRNKHLQDVQPRVENDMVRLGGATLGAPLEEGQPPQMTGSAFVLRGHTEQEVREFLEKDVYTTSGVWNLAEASFIPNGGEELKLSCAVSEISMEASPWSIRVKEKPFIGLFVVQVYDSVYMVYSQT
ncbi:MAG: hypothetical protein GOMPHAMPRED_004304 [Gomphillus americanus]|uniref:YCII-related domain-containing protein n=1 Tax=Gomphillus americanus TaxID=1940652 RepID=A0A8H3FNI6_9LECA|nr:MAG: hypothetical protein GOMPHAMPRED_004304 [Gomphillus americanus]